MRSIFFFLSIFYIVSYGQSVVTRVYFNYPNAVSQLGIIDYNSTGKIVNRFAQLNAVVGIITIGAQNLITGGGYVASDDTNVYTFQTYKGETPPALQVVQFSHSTCLGIYQTDGTNPISAITLDPTNSFYYLAYTNVASITKLNYAGFNAHTISYPPFIGTSQMLLNYNTMVLYIVNTIGDTKFYSYNLNTNISSRVNTSSLTGGIAIDLNTGGKVYFASQGTIQNYNPATGLFASVYSNTDYTIRGMAIDSTNGLLFFSAESASKMNSNMFVLSVTLPAGTANGNPIQLEPTLAKQFVSMAIAHCPPGACGNCGSTGTADGNTLIISLSLMTLLIIGLVML